MAILITGGAGYIGTHTCVELIHAGYELVVVDNFANSKPQALERVSEITGRPVKVYRLDLRDQAGLENVFRENTIEAVIHFAGLKLSENRSSSRCCTTTQILCVRSCSVKSCRSLTSIDSFSVHLPPCTGCRSRYRLTRMLRYKR